MKSLMHDPDYYTKSFHAYAKNSKKFAVLEKWGDNIFPKLVGDRLAYTLPADTNINMLGIGSGSGKIYFLVREREKYIKRERERET